MKKKGGARGDHNVPKGSSSQAKVDIQAVFRERSASLSLDKLDEGRVFVADLLVVRMNGSP
jgi:hypothetical protein